MRLLPEDEVRFSVDDMVFRESTISRLALVLVLVGIIVGASVAFAQGSLPWGPYLVIACGTGFFAIVFGYTLLRTFSAANWLLAANPRRMLIRLRSYLHRTPVGEAGVLELPFSEVAAVRMSRKTMMVPSGDGGSTKYATTYLDVLLQSDAGEELKECLKRCRMRQGFQHFPVSLPDPRTLRLEWRSDQSGIRPGMRKALDHLRHCVEVLDPLTESRDFTSPMLQPSKEMEAQVLELVEQGNRIPAIKLVRKAYGLSLSEATRFVDELRG